MGNNEREVIKQICDEENFEELLLRIRAKGKSNKLNKILNEIENDSRLSKKLKKSIYEDFFDYVTEINQSYMASLKEIFCFGAERALNKINDKKGSSNMSIKTRLIIADADVHICKFIQDSLSKNEDIEILGVANTDEDEIRMIEELKPEIVITDLMRNHKYTGLDIIKDYFNRKSPVKFLVVSADRKEDVIRDGLDVAIKDKKYTEFEFEIMKSEIYNYMEIDEEDPDVIETLKDTRKYIADKGVSQEEFDKIINKLDSLNI